MTAWLKARLSSLGVHLLLPLFLAIAGVLAAHAYISFRSTKVEFYQFVGVEAERSSGLIRRATHDGMLLNRLDEVQATIERLSEGPEIVAIRVWDKRGAVVLSSTPDEIGQRVTLDAPPCVGCHPVDAQGGTLMDMSEVTSVAGHEVIRHLSIIENEPGCTVAGCHENAVGEAVLGSLEVEMSMLPLESALASARTQLIWTTVVILLVIGVLTTVIFRHLIYRPIRLLQEGARRIAQGDLSTQIKVPGAHELACLARDFNHMVMDLTGMQAELKGWSQTLEQKVLEKTSELREIQGQVLHMEKMASLGKLSATVAHEINNPISGVLTYSRLIERELADQPIDPEKREELEHYLHLVQRESTRCGRIVQNLLAFSRRTGTEFEPINVNEVVEHSLMLVRHFLELSQVTLETELLATDTEIVADAGQIEQALVALFVNATEAMPGGGELQVRLRGTSEGVEFLVTDTGAGMPPELLRQVFEPFFSTKRNESGVGLGLAVVYGIVHRHGGTIEIDSIPDRGTSVRMFLPRTPPAEEDESDSLERPEQMATADPIEL